ncbi:hypothetical protein F4861DRAFT_510385 [Xylaria intraflava]|nr:hypothetical protein F4861DRAFT_510385 [Xylaria intraflava]
MAKSDRATPFHSIADIATASWYAHRASSPQSKQSPLAAHGSTRRERSASGSAPPLSPELRPVIAASIVSPLPAPTSSLGDNPSRRDGEAQASTDAGIQSDITAWQSALQSLPPEFSGAEPPFHPLAQALVNQPTLRPVEWNQYRLVGGFVPRTPHDYSSLMIYISGQVNPNPCRNCLLRNGPFAQCVVSPPDVLAINTIRHACANCTYQNQYRKCTHEPITEAERARSAVVRPALKAKHAIPKMTIPRMPISRARRKMEGRRQEKEERKERIWAQEHPQRQQQLEHQEKTPMTRSPTLIGPGTSEGSFDEKLRHIRALSPRSRRKITAETLQWQAAIATIEAEGPILAPNVFAAHEAEPSSDLGASLHIYSPSQSISTPSATLAGSLFVKGATAGMEAAGIGTEYTYEPMEEDDRSGEH